MYVLFQIVPYTCCGALEFDTRMMHSKNILAGSVKQNDFKI